MAGNRTCIVPETTPVQKSLVLVVVNRQGGFLLLLLKAGENKTTYTYNYNTQINKMTLNLINKYVLGMLKDSRVPEHFSSNATFRCVPNQICHKLHNFRNGGGE